MAKIRSSGPKVGRSTVTGGPNAGSVKQEARTGSPPNRGSEPSLPLAAVPDDVLWSLFTRFDGGWTGGDGTYSVPLGDGRTVWLFSDTFLGPVNPDRSRATSAPFLRNTVVVEQDNRLTTLHGGTRTTPRAFFRPSDGASWYWVTDGTVEGGHLKVFLQKFVRLGDGPWQWQWVGTDLASLRLPDLTLEAIRPASGQQRIRFGVAVLEERGYTYIYGVEDLRHVKYAHLARAKRGEIDGTWEFFNGRGWTSHASDSARILDARVGTEFSVVKYGGRYRLITFDTARPLWEWRDIVAFTADRPSGPWSRSDVLYSAPEAAHDQWFVYNAHAHPQFAGDGWLVLSYNVNSFQLDNLYADADLYRARFIRVFIGDSVQPPPATSEREPGSTTRAKGPAAMIG